MNSYRKLGDLLVSSGLITNLQLSIALAAQQTSNRRLGEILVDREFASEEQIAVCLAEQYGYPIAVLENAKPQPAALQAIKADIALEHCVLPLRVEGDTLECVIADPLDVIATDEVTNATKKKLSLQIAPREKLTKAIRFFYGLEEKAALDSQVEGYETPSRFGNLRPRRQVGEVVLFDAFDHQLDRRVTLAAGPAETEWEKRHHRLVQSAARVPSKWIAAVHDWFVFGDHSWAVFERLEGESLAHILRTRGPRSISQSAELVAQLAEGVDSLNQAGGYCGLLTPENILIRQGGALLTPLVEPAKEYLAPEIEMGDHGDNLTDVYSLGTILWECVLGENPHFKAAVRAGFKFTWAEPTLENTSLPTAFNEVLVQCLAKEPGDRYASAILLANILRSYNWAVLAAAASSGFDVGHEDREHLLTVISNRNGQPVKQSFWKKLFGARAA